MSRSSAEPAPIGEDEIHVFVSFLDSGRDGHGVGLHQAILEPHELSRASRFHFEKDRRRYLATRALARTVLSRYVSIAPEKLRFSANAYGRPAIANQLDQHTAIRFNISHTEGLVVLALTNGREVGIDVENVTARDIMLEVADRFFAASEAAELRSLPAAARKRRFFECWTLKESYIKARGMGLSLDLRKFAFRFPQDPTIIFDVEPDLDDSGDRWRFWQFEASPDYLFALCAERVGNQPQRLTFSAVVPCGPEQEFRPMFIRRPEHGPTSFPTKGRQTCSR